MTITIELPEDVAARLSGLPEAERQAFAVAALRQATERPGGVETFPLTEEDHRAIAEALSDLDAGRARTRPASEFFDELARPKAVTTKGGSQCCAFDTRPVLPTTVTP